MGRPAHPYRVANPDHEVRRAVTQRLQMPSFVRVTHRVASVFDAEDPHVD